MGSAVILSDKMQPKASYLFSRYFPSGADAFSGNEITEFTYDRHIIFNSCT